MRAALAVTACLAALACNGGGGHGPPSAMPPSAAPEGGGAAEAFADAPGPEAAPEEREDEGAAEEPQSGEPQSGEPQSGEPQSGEEERVPEGDREGAGGASGARAQDSSIAARPAESGLEPSEVGSDLEASRVGSNVQGGAVGGDLEVSGVAGERGDADRADSQGGAEDTGGQDGGGGAERAPSGVAEVECEGDPLPPRLQVHFEVGHSARDLALWYAETACEPVEAPRRALGRRARARVDGLVGQDELFGFLDSLAGDLGLGARRTERGVALIDTEIGAGGGDRNGSRDGAAPGETILFLPEGSVEGGEGGQEGDESDEGGEGEGAP